MGLHIKKSIKLGDFIKINANKSGPSVTVGGKKAKVTLNSKKVTASLPGTGISYDAKLPGADKKKTSSAGKKVTAKKPAASTGKKTTSKKG